MRYSMRMLALVLPVVAASVRADDWPQWLGPQRDSVWRETGILAKFPEGGPKVKWRLPIAGGYAGPAVAAGKVYVPDYNADGDKSPNPGKVNNLDGQERLWCLSADDGKEIWKHEYQCKYAVSYPAGPRCTPTVDGDRIYTLGSMGNLYCLDAATGKPVWSKDFKQDYMLKVPMWGCTGHPLVDGNKLICLVGGDGSVVVAFDKTNGKELWKALSSKEPGYSPPSIIEAGGKRQLILWHTESINSLNPETGEVYWTVPLVPSYGMSIMAPRKHGDYLFTSGIGEKSLLLRLASDKPAVDEVWRHSDRKTSVYCINSTPFIEDGVIYGVDQPGHLRAVKLETGKRLWETLAPTTGNRPQSSATAFIVKNGDRFFLMAETGHLVIAKLTPEKYDEISRAKLLEPTTDAFGRQVVWSHPAFANKCLFARNDKEIVCASLAETGGK